MMAALSLDSCFRAEGGDDDEEDEDDDELVGLSTKPASWGALPSFLLAEAEDEEVGWSAETAGHGSFQPRASQLSNR